MDIPHVINYSKKDFAKEVMKITNNKGVSAVFDGVGKKTFLGSLACLSTRGMMISFECIWTSRPSQCSQRYSTEGSIFNKTIGSSVFYK